MEEAKNLSALLDIFADVSGLQINQGKSVLVCFGLSLEKRSMLPSTWDKDQKASDEISQPIAAEGCQ